MAHDMETRSPNVGRGLNKGDMVPAHFHQEDHTAVFSNGSWRITVEKKVNFNGRMEWGGNFVIDEMREGPFTLLVKGSERHEFHYLGQKIPEWMERYLAALPDSVALAFRREYENRPGFVHCVFPGEAK